MNDEDKPYIVPPDELEDSPRNGLICFMNMDRQCGPDCMAYTTFVTEAPHLSDQQKHCSIIVGVERLGRYAGGLLSIIRKDSADARRSGTKPPDPKGDG